jgi:hypothetical protein
MNKPEDFPVDYTPYKEMELCSNSFVNTPIPVEVEGHAPLLIGKGTEPRVWLSAPVSHDKTQWTVLVADNESQVPDIDVKKTLEGTLEVFAAGKKVLSVRGTGFDTAAVSWVDLRPLGFDIHGDASALWIGTNQFSNNRIENCRAGIGIAS